MNFISEHKPRNFTKIKIEIITLITTLKRLTKLKNATESPVSEKANIVNSAIKFSIFVIPFS